MTRFFPNNDKLSTDRSEAGFTIIGVNIIVAGKSNESNWSTPGNRPGLFGQEIYGTELPLTMHTE